MQNNNNNLNVKFYEATRNIWLKRELELRSYEAVAMRLVEKGRFLLFRRGFCVYFCMEINFSLNYAPAVNAT